MALRLTLSCQVDSLAPMARRRDRSALDDGGVTGGAASTGSAARLFSGLFLPAGRLGPGCGCNRRPGTDRLFRSVVPTAAGGGSG
eukprot:scaffold72915_cov69-Phaeocystis_antarctica.AAC.2